MLRGVPDIGRDRGSALILALTFLAVLMIATSAFIANVIATTNAQSRLETQTRSFYIADAGVNYALWRLGQQGDAFKGESDIEFGDGSFDIQVLDQPGDPMKKTIISTSRLNGYPEQMQQKVQASVMLQNSDDKRTVTLIGWERQL